MKKTNIEENIENIIIDLIIKGSEDRLIVFKSKENDNTVDLIIKKRGEYKNQELSLKINIIKGALQENFIPNKDFYLMFVNFDEVKQKISNIGIAFPHKDKKILVDQKELGNFLLEIIEAKK